MPHSIQKMENITISILRFLSAPVGLVSNPKHLSSTIEGNKEWLGVIRVAHPSPRIAATHGKKKGYQQSYCLHPVSSQEPSLIQHDSTPHIKWDVDQWIRETVAKTIQGQRNAIRNNSLS